MQRITSVASMQLLKRITSNRRINHFKIVDEKELQEYYQYKRLIGRGSFGVVYEVKEKKTDTLKALKIIEKGKLGNRKSDIEREISILKMVNHPHIIYLEVIYESSNNYFLIFELCRGGTLDKLLEKKKKLSQAEVIKIIKELTSAVAYLHRNDIVHRDLKLENILLTTNPEKPDDNTFVKIVDFGLSTVLSKRSHKAMLSGVVGTSVYMPPEILQTQSYSQQCDIWSLGIIMFVLLTGTFPFYDKKADTLKTLICTQEIDYSNYDISDELQQLLKKMLDKNPAYRITSPELETHPCLTGRPSTLRETFFDKMRKWKPELQKMSDEGKKTLEWPTNATNGASTSFPDDIAMPATTSYNHRVGSCSSMNKNQK